MRNRWYHACMGICDRDGFCWNITRVSSIIAFARETEVEAKIAYINVFLAQRFNPKEEEDFILKERDILLQQYPEYFI